MDNLLGLDAMFERGTTEDLIIEKYVEESLPIVARAKGIPLADSIKIEELKEKITSIARSRFKNRSIEINNNYTLENTKCDLSDVVDFYIKEKPIMTGFGVMFFNHYDKENLKAEMINYISAKRKEKKKTKFICRDNGDEEGFKKNEMGDKTFKLINNSYYGVCGEKNSIFFNKYIGPSITYTGYQIITTSILCFEMILANNVKYNNIDDLLIYLNRIIDIDTSDTSIYEFIDDYKIPNELDAYNQLMTLADFKSTAEQRQQIKRIIDNLTEEQRIHVFYKNNLYGLFDNTYCSERLEKLTKYEVIKTEELEDDVQVLTNEIWMAIEKLCIYDYAFYDRFERTLNMKREAVLVIDTDSNFLSLDKFNNYMIDTFNLDRNDEIREFSNVGVAVVLMTKAIDMALNRLTENCNVPEEFRSKIKMKNEFYYRTLMTTRNKKQYAGLTRLQEGNIVPDHKAIDMKGLSIKKANVNKRCREFFTDIIENYILRVENIDLNVILSKFFEFEDEIRTSLLNGEITFLSPSKANEFSSYKAPHTIQAARGVMCYNTIYKDLPIALPTKVNTIKLNCKSMNDLDVIKDDFPDIYEIIINEIFESDDKDLSAFTMKNGFNAISLPKSAKVIPEWIRPLIDIDNIIDDNIRPGMLIIESLGVHLMAADNKEFYSTVVDF